MPLHSPFISKNLHLNIRADPTPNILLSSRLIQKESQAGTLHTPSFCLQQLTLLDAGFDPHSLAFGKKWAFEIWEQRPRKNWMNVNCQTRKRWKNMELGERNWSTLSFPIRCRMQCETGRHGVGDLTLSIPFIRYRLDLLIYIVVLYFFIILYLIYYLNFDKYFFNHIILIYSYRIKYFLYRIIYFIIF